MNNKEISVYDKIMAELNIIDIILKFQILKTDDFHSTYPFHFIDSKGKRIESGNYIDYLLISSDVALFEFELYKNHFVTRFENTNHKELLFSELSDIQIKAKEIVNFYNEYFPSIELISINYLKQRFSNKNCSLALILVKNNCIHKFYTQHELKEIGSVNLADYPFGNPLLCIELAYKCDLLIDFIAKFNIPAKVETNEIIIKEEITKEIPNAYKYKNYNRDSRSLKDFYEELIKGENPFIDKNTEFKNFLKIFNNEIPTNPIVWCNSISALADLIKILHLEKEVIEKQTLTIWKTTAKIFVDKNGNKFEVSKFRNAKKSAYYKKLVMASDKLKNTQPFL